MSVRPQWRLIHEIGIDYAPPASGASGEQLSYPVLAERAADGTTLIVDEMSYPKNLTVLNECRTIRVDRGHRVLFDSTAVGVHDGFGCLLGDGRVGLLRRTMWELLVMTADATVVRRIALEPFSRRMPRVVTWTPQHTFLVAFVDRVYEVDIIEIDEAGRLLWYLPRDAASAIGCPSSVQLLSSGHVLVADEFGHVVLELRRDGSVAWQAGVRREPSDAPGHLSNPSSARELADGSRLVADFRNDRVLRFAPNGTTDAVRSQDGDLSSPTFANALPDGHLLVCDAGNRRVVELDGHGDVAWSYGERLTCQRWFSFPRSVEMAGDGALMVADTCHNRVVVLDEEAVSPIDVSIESSLFWPRAARRTHAGTCIVADGRHSRVVEITPAGEILRELHALALDPPLPLGDPHDAHLLPDDHVLLVDAMRNVVAKADWSGRVDWVVGLDAATKLKDPHSAQILPDGRVLITDTAQHRVAWIDPVARTVTGLDAVRDAAGVWYRLHHPRYAEVGSDGVLLIVDSGNNRVLAVGVDGVLRWELSQVPDSRISILGQPRWAQLLGSDEVLVSDHLHHRILHLSCGPEVT